MLYLVSGNVGTGKTYQQIMVICDKLLSGANVISNIDFYYQKFSYYHIREKKYKNKEFGKYIYRPELKTDFLVHYANKYHNLSPNAPENQTLVIIDESSHYFNNREWNTKSDRKEWIEFVEHHRKLKYTLIMIIQDWEDLDIKIQRKAEYIEEHKLVNNAGGPGILLNALKVKMFVTVTRWNTSERKIVKKEFFRYKSLYGKFYNTNQLLNNVSVLSEKVKSMTFEIPELENQYKMQKKMKESYEANRWTLGKALKKALNTNNKKKEKSKGASSAEAQFGMRNDCFMMQCYLLTCGYRT